MRTNFKIILCTIILFFVSCSKNNNPINPFFYNDGNNILSINTDSTSYSWQQGESNDYIIIQGTLRNESDSIFYSSLGDGFDPFEQDQLHIAGNSEGCLEKYNASDNSWKEKDICGYLIEGSRVVPIKSSQVYSIFAHISKSSNENESGKYRIRISYYHAENPNSSVIPFNSYSNEFEIKQ